jgi:hypothetical protein
MAVINVGSLELPEERKPTMGGSGGLPQVYVETDVDLARERRALSHAAGVRSKGYGMYLDGKKPEEIAKELGVPKDVVLVWARDGGWAVRLKRVNDAHEVLVRENVRRARLDRAEEDVESSLKLGRRIREVVHKRLENPDGLRTQDIKNLADAGKASVDTSAHGMGGSQESEAAEKEGRRPLVIVFQDGLPPRREKTVEGEVL